MRSSASHGIPFFCDAILELSQGQTPPKCISSSYVMQPVITLPVNFTLAAIALNQLKLYLTFVADFRSRNPTGRLAGTLRFGCMTAGSSVYPRLEDDTQFNGEIAWTISHRIPLYELQPVKSRKGRNFWVTSPREWSRFFEMRCMYK